MVKKKERTVRTAQRRFAGLLRIGGVRCLVALVALAPVKSSSAENTPPIIDLIRGYVFLVHPTPYTNMIPFTVADAESPPEALKLSATSSNQLLLPDSAIAFGGSGTNRTLIFAPTPRQSGTTRIMVTVEDHQGGASTASVVLAGTPCNGAPTISNVSDRVLDENHVSGVIPFLVDDCNSLPEELRVTATSSNEALIPARRLVLGGEGKERTLELHPLPNTHGSATITLTLVTWQGLTASKWFTLTVRQNVGPLIPDRLLVSALKNTPQTISLRGSFVADFPLTYRIVSSPTNGILNGEPPDLTYVPKQDIVGSDRFLFTVNDGLAESEPATVNIEVTQTPLVRFLPPILLAFAQPRFDVTAPSGSVVVIESSFSFGNWQRFVVLTNTSSVQSFELSRDWNPPGFFRARLSE